MLTLLVLRNSHIYAEEDGPPFSYVAGVWAVKIPYYVAGVWLTSKPPEKTIEPCVPNVVRAAVVIVALIPAGVDLVNAPVVEL